MPLSAVRVCNVDLDHVVSRLARLAAEGGELKIGRARATLRLEVEGRHARVPYPVAEHAPSPARGHHIWARAAANRRAVAVVGAMLLVLVNDAVAGKGRELDDEPRLRLENEEVGGGVKQLGGAAICDGYPVALARIGLKHGHRDGT